MTIIRSGELFAVVMPSRRTSSGRRGSAIETRFWTSTCACVEIGAELEGDGERHRAVGGGIGRHVEHVLDAVDFLFDRRRHGRGDGLGVGARIGGAHHDGRWSDFWILRDRKLRIGDAADEQRARCERTDAKIGRSTKKWANFIASALRLQPSGGSVVISGLTLTPGRTRISPLMTMVSSPVSPSRMTR